jgi:opacity protein-like surface antigen
MRTLLAIVALCLMPALAAAKGFYVQTMAGANWTDPTSALGTSSDTGFVLGGSVGTSIDAVPGLSLEGEVSFRNNSLSTFGGFIDGDQDQTAVMVNARYDVLQDGYYRPYVLAGVGYGLNKLSIENSPLAFESQGVAWQVGAGIDLRVADGVFVGAGYRYLQTPEVEVLGFELSDGANHSVVATARFQFN